MTTTVRIMSLGAVPRALVIEQPSWLSVIFLRAESREWTAYAIERIIRCGSSGPMTERIWYRDSREQRPVRVPMSIERQLEDAREGALATGALSDRLTWLRNRDVQR